VTASLPSHRTFAVEATIGQQSIRVSTAERPAQVESCIPCIGRFMCIMVIVVLPYVVFQAI
jgi:hypothetical protein